MYFILSDTYSQPLLPACKKILSSYNVLSNEIVLPHSPLNDKIRTLETLFQSLYNITSGQYYLICLTEQLLLEGKKLFLGLASHNYKIAMISTNYPGVNHEKITMTIIHEFGHMIGLNHCDNINCIMYQCVNLEPQTKLCETCLSTFKEH